MCIRDRWCSFVVWRFRVPRGPRYRWVATGNPSPRGVTLTWSNRYSDVNFTWSRAVNRATWWWWRLILRNQFTDLLIQIKDVYKRQTESFIFIIVHNILLLCRVLTYLEKECVRTEAYDSPRTVAKSSGQERNDSTLYETQRCTARS